MPTLLPPIPEPKKRGRPRRSDLPAERVSLRIDSFSKAVVEDKFGTLGNAVYYLAGFLRTFRCLPLDLLKESDVLTDSDIELLRSLINEKLDAHRGPDSKAAPLVTTLRHLESLLPSAPGAAGAPRGFG